MAKREIAAKAIKATKAKKAPAKPFDPASIPVMAYHVQSFKTFGNSKQRKRIVDFDGIGAAALMTNEKDAPGLLKDGEKLAYIGEDLCVVTADLSVIERVAASNYEPELIPKAMAFYREHVGRPIDLDSPVFENVRGEPYGIYRDCIDGEDFDKVDAEMAARYDRILAMNAAEAKKPMGEPKQLFVEDVPGRTIEASIVHFAWAAHEHDKYAKEWHDLAIQYSNVWKAKHGLAKVDHACPCYRAFTRAPWMQHRHHRGLAGLARSFLSRVTGQYSVKLDESISIPG